MDIKLFITLKKLTPKAKRTLELFIIIGIALISFFFWNSHAIYPVKLFVVLCHEVCHGIASVLTGGKLIAIEINEHLGGQCLSKGGIPFVVASAGYLGSLTIGAMLFISGYKKTFSIWLCTILAAILLLFASNFIIGTLGKILSLLFVVVLFVSPRFFNIIIHSYLMKILGLLSSLYALIDIKEDLLTFEYRESDAQVLAEITNIPAIFWGLLWLSISAGVIYLMFKFGYRKGLTK